MIIGSYRGFVAVAMVAPASRGPRCRPWQRHVQSINDLPVIVNKLDGNGYYGTFVLK
jgi:hypothetical protein